MFVISISSRTMTPSVVARGPIVEPITFLFLTYECNSLGLDLLELAMCFSIFILLCLINLLVSLRAPQNASLSLLVTKCLSYARFSIVKLVPISLFHHFGFVLTCLRLFRKGTHWLKAPLKVTRKIFKDLLMSLEVNILLQPEFSSKFLSFTVCTTKVRYL